MQGHLIRLSIVVFRHKLAFWKQHIKCFKGIMSKLEQVLMRSWWQNHALIRNQNITFSSWLLDIYQFGHPSFECPWYTVFSTVFLTVAITKNSAACFKIFSMKAAQFSCFSIEQNHCVRTTLTSGTNSTAFIVRKNMDVIAISNRPSVTGAVLHTLSSLVNSVED